MIQVARQWPHTCQWIFSKDSYRGWMLGVQPRLLWCHARPGAGKSVLASFLLQQFREAGEICCYFPFRYNNEALRPAQHLVRNIAFQLAEQDMSMRQCLLDISAADLDLQSARLGYIWQKLFCNGVLRLESSEPIYWIIDAIDEAEPLELALFLSLLSDLQRSAIPVKVIIFSRYTRGIASRLLALPLAVTELVRDDNSQDIYRYANERLLNSPLMLEAKQRTDLLDIIVGRANGTFLWVVKTIDALEQEDSVDGITYAIEHSFKNLTELYDDILARMSQMKDPQKRMAKLMLCWIICAARPMSTAELAVVVKASFREVVNIKSAVRNLCGQLLSIDEHDRVQANHMTVQEYLRDCSHEWFSIDEDASNERITKFCLYVLSNRQFILDDNISGEWILDLSDIEKFREYASLFWAVHICRLPASSTWIAQVDAFLESNGGLTLLMELTRRARLDTLLLAIKSLEAWAFNSKDPSSIRILDKLRRLSSLLGYSYDTYEGELVDNLRHGFGKCIYANGDIYSGEWKGDLREGQGMCTFSSGNVYKGTWANDEFHGTGQLVCPDGNAYDGEWAYGRREGFGTMRWTWTERFEYTGEWKKDRFDGYGTMVFLFGTKYTGQWSAGREHGDGKIVYWNGDSYEGPFEDGCEIEEIGRVGQASVTTVYKDQSSPIATVHYTTGARYEGEVNDKGLPDGKGILYANTGVSLSGTFVNGRAEGHASVRRPNGGTMTGPWKNHVAFGHFVDINDYPEGGKFIGQLIDAAREGPGILQSAFKYDYEGEFHRNEMHGHGIRRYYNGDVYEGESQDGWMEGKGVMRYADKWIFDGSWEKDMKHGSDGVLVLHGWGKFKGDWKNNRLTTNASLQLGGGRSVAELP